MGLLVCDELLLYMYKQDAQLS